MATDVRSMVFFSGEVLTVDQFGNPTKIINIRKAKYIKAKKRYIKLLPDLKRQFIMAPANFYRPGGHRL